MSASAPEPEDRGSSAFEKMAREKGERGVWREFWGFLRENRKWWMIPLVVVFLLFGVLVLLSSTGFAPFVYTLF
jgi:hypothetical protein